MAAGDTQITIARIRDLRNRALSARLTRNADGASYRPIVKHAVNPGEKYGRLTIIGEVRKVAPSG